MKLFFEWVEDVEEVVEESSVARVEAELLNLIFDDRFSSEQRAVAQ